MNHPGFRHLSYEERIVIERSMEHGYSIRKIAGILCRSPNTVSKEIERNTVKGEYLAKKAKQKAYFARYNSKYQAFRALSFENIIRAKLKLRWSPERISGHLKRNNLFVSPKAIYKFCYSRCLEYYLWKPKRRKQRKACYLSDSRRFLEIRPKIIGLGHFEADFIVCSQNTYSLLVLTEKQTRISFIERIENKTKESIFKAFQNIVNQVKILTVTTDNDIAFSCWKELEKKFDFQIYFCHPYRSWEKPLVEETNQLIRRFIPKGSNLRLVSQRKLKEIDQFLNHAPRQCLNYLTCYEKYQQITQ